MNNKPLLFVSDSLDPWYNLAVEEALFDAYGENHIVFYLWRNENTVVVGKNQNVFKECRIDEIKKQKGKIARRTSGGGAVFHDSGNLNFTFIMPKQIYDVERQLEVILRAVRSFGINAIFTGRNDLTVDGRKFSGNAFCQKSKKAFHHGTILLKADMSKLGEYLQVSKSKMKSKGVTSVKSRVVNLCSLSDDINVESMKKALIESFSLEYGKPTILEAKLDVSEYYEKFASWDFVYGKNPAFDLIIENRFPFGGVEICLSTKKGYIEEAIIFTDAMDANLYERIAQALVGIKFSKETIADTIESFKNESSEISVEVKALGAFVRDFEL